MLARQSLIGMQQKTRKQKYMKIIRNKLLIAAAVVCLLSLKAGATSITGGVSLGGQVTSDTGNVNTGNTFTFGGVNVASVAGSYASVPTTGMVGTPAVTQNPLTLGTLPIMPLWTFSFGGKTYDFNLTSITEVDRHIASAITVTGFGTLQITGFEDTFGSYTFTANNLGGTFSFSSSNGAVPDGGTTITLLGAALSGLACVGALKKK
jgi:hypothetical protein